MSQCVRKVPLKKPDVELRRHPLQKVLAASAELYKVLLLHPEPFRHEQARQRCFCGTKSNNKMVLCETCHEWYHLSCVGLTEDKAEGEQNWQCGYCVAPRGADGNRSWALFVPQGKRKRARVAPARNDANMPKTRGVACDNDKEVVGPMTWEDFITSAREGGRKINEKEAKLKRRAEALVKEGGHHVVDAVTMGGVAARGVDNPLVDELYHLGEIQDDDDGEPADEEGAGDA